MRSYVGVTDGDWYRFLAARPEINEVNFWRPGGGRVFRALQPGEPFFFKSHHPHNRVVGGGFFNGFARLRLSEAWAIFGLGNGVPDAQQMRNRIHHYRRTPLSPDEDPEIGCVLIRDTRFFPDTPADPPPDFAPNVVQGRGYDLTNPGWSDYFENLLHRLLDIDLDLHHVDLDLDLSQPWHRTGPVYGDPRLAPHRLGQQAFRAVVLNAYNRRCAFTGTHISPVLQAAHVRPLPSGGEHRLTNGLLLRSDVHTLFDAGYLGIDTRHRLMVSPRLRTEFGNGEQFYAKAGQTISLPEQKSDHPADGDIEWHLDEVFRHH